MEPKNLPDHVEIPIEYYPDGIGPGGFSPSTMRLMAVAYNRGRIHEMENKSWVIMWLLDNVDWDKVPNKLFNYGK